MIDRSGLSMRFRNTSVLHMLLALSLGLSGLLAAWPQPFAAAQKSSHAEQHQRERIRANDGHGHRQGPSKHERSHKGGARHDKGQEHQGKKGERAISKP